MTSNSDKIGAVIIISAPSGTGKTSLVQQLVQRVDDIEVSVSHTTRPPRAGEIDGTHYHFVNRPQFAALVAQDDMLEYAQVFDNMYGTSGSFVAERLQAGKDVILEIDWQGAAIARRKLDNVVTIMILPPSQDALAERLRGRGKDASDVIARRLDEATQEMSHYAEFDYLVVNDQFERALHELCAIVTGERLRSSRQQRQLGGLLDDLMAPSSTLAANG